MSGVAASGSLCGGKIPSDSRTKSVPTLKMTTMMNPATTATILLNVCLFILFAPSRLARLIACSFLLRVVDHPLDSKLVSEHAEVGPPERIRQRLFHFPPGGESVED